VVTRILTLKNELKRQLISLDKCQFVQTVVEIFPKLRDPEITLGYVNIVQFKQYIKKFKYSIHILKQNFYIFILFIFLRIFLRSSN